MYLMIYGGASGFSPVKAQDETKLVLFLTITLRGSVVGPLITSFSAALEEERSNIILEPAAYILFEEPV